MLHHSPKENRRKHRLAAIDGNADVRDPAGTQHPLIAGQAVCGAVRPGDVEPFLFPVDPFGPRSGQQLDVLAVAEKGFVVHHVKGELPGTTGLLARRQQIVVGRRGTHPRRTNSRVLPMTVKLESSMAVAATSGVSSPLMATGMLTRL